MMEHSKLAFVAGGGLIERRSFLQSGLKFAFAASALPSASIPLSALAADKIGQSLPLWSKTPGALDIEYGKPAEHEMDIKRVPMKSIPTPMGLNVLLSPINRQRGMITPSGLHYTVHHSGVPDILPEKHSLKIHGWVKNPLKFDLETLERFPLVSSIRFLECAGNTGLNAGAPFAYDVDSQELFGQMSCSEWTGVSLRSLFAETGLKEGAKWAIVEGADGASHARSLPLSKLLDDCFIALYQNGERIRPSQGYPMRLFVPGWEGNVNVKWVHRIEITDAPAFTKDESGMYSEVLSDGRIERFTFPMAVKSFINHPSGQQQLNDPKGYYEIRGYAWSGMGKISRVEVSADGGKSWANADLHPPVLEKALTAFSLPWRWSGAATILISRAFDDKGNAQPTRSEWKKRYNQISINHYSAIHGWKIGSDGRVKNTYV